MFGRSKFTTWLMPSTDIAARGIDVDGISHVVNFDLPHIPETYVHRIGRTARAGADGTAISLCDREELTFLRDIEKLIGKSIPSDNRPRANGNAASAHRHGGERHAPSRGEQRGRQVYNDARERRPQGPGRAGPAGDRGVRLRAPRHRAATRARDRLTVASRVSVWRGAIGSSP